jgi:hypothetical protein
VWYPKHERNLTLLSGVDPQRYSSSFFFEGPPVVITQRGTAQVNITLLGNAFWGDNDTALSGKLDKGGAGRNSAVANLLADYGLDHGLDHGLDGLRHGAGDSGDRGSSGGRGDRGGDGDGNSRGRGLGSGGPQTGIYGEIRNPATNGTIAAAIDDFRRLGALDLVLNHPAVVGSDSAGL